MCIRDRHQHCSLRAHHSASRAAAGNAAYAQSITTQFTVEAWVSSLDFRVNRCQRTYPLLPSGVSVDPNIGTADDCLAPDVANGPTAGRTTLWPRTGRQDPYIWPRNSLGRGQRVLFAIAEPDARAGWFQTANGRADRGLLQDLCRTDANVGLGLALVVNENGCFQLVLGQRSRSGGTDNLYGNECITVPSASYADGCPSAHQPWIHEASQYKECRTFAANGVDCDEWKDTLAMGFDYRVLERFVNDVTQNPTNPHHIVVSVNQLDSRNMHAEFAERATHARAEDFAPKWAIYIDGQVAASSTFLNQDFLNTYPDTPSAPHDSTNAGQNRAMEYYGDEQLFGSSTLWFPETAPNLNDLITPTMRLVLGSDGLAQDSWWVENADGVPADPSQAHTTGGNTQTNHLSWLIDRSPVMNAHPLVGSIEMVALHGRAFTPAEASSHYHAGLPNQPPRITTGLVALSVFEDTCGALALTAQDDDNLRFGRSQAITWNLVSSTHSVYTDDACTAVAVVGGSTTYQALYYLSLIHI